MHVIVLGAGVIGVTTAYYLVQQGCDVTVIDRGHDVACGASHANGGQLSYGFTDSLARPSFVSRLPAIVAGRDFGARVSLSPKLLSWGARFLAQCTSERARRNMIELLQLAMRSSDLMNELHKNLPLEFSFRPAGKLVILDDDEQIKAFEKSTRLKFRHGCEVNLVSREDALAIEPALHHFEEPFSAAVYSRHDGVADARLFVTGLRNYLEETGRVRFRLGEKVMRLIRSNGKVVGAACDDDIDADAVVVCLGAWSGELLRSVGFDPYIYPVRGYSLTLPPGPAAPSVSITSDRCRLVFSSLNGNIRIAGFADFRGFDTSNDDTRTGMLATVAQRVAPQAADYTAEQRFPWGGFRPMTPNGQPRVGATHIDGLFVNTGHGMLGWTLACASGHDAATAITRLQ